MGVGWEEKGQGVLGEGPSGARARDVPFALNRAAGKFHTDQYLLLWVPYGHRFL